MVSFKSISAVCYINQIRLEPSFHSYRNQSIDMQCEINCLLSIYSVSLYSVRMRKNADQNNCEYGHFLHSVTLNYDEGILCILSNNRIKN